MSSIVIDSIDDPRLQPYRGIRYRDPTGESDRFIAEGRLVVERLILSRHRCESLPVRRGYDPYLITLAKQADESTEIYEADSELLRALVGFDFHRGVLACGRRPVRPSIRHLKLSAAGHASRGSVLCVCSVDNPENIGGLMRTAVAFGISAMAITADVAEPFSRRALRVSMAAAFKLEIFSIDDPVDDVRFLNQPLGFRTVATTLAAGATQLEHFRGDGRPLAILVGNEGSGLPDAVQHEATDRITIPMQSGTDSLNVNVATAIVLYALNRAAPGSE